MRKADGSYHFLAAPVVTGSVAPTVDLLSVSVWLFIGNLMVDPLLSSDDLNSSGIDPVIENGFPDCCWRMNSARSFFAFLKKSKQVPFI